MLKPLPQEQSGLGKIYPVGVDVVQAFVSNNGFKGTHVISDYSIWYKNPIALRIPRIQNITKSDVCVILDKADLNLEDFEKFVPQYLQDKKAAQIKFDILIEQSLHTPPRNK